MGSGLLVGLVVPAIAQETTATLQGYVKDPTGAVVAKAKVEAASPALIGTKAVDTDSAGYYHLSNLPVGVYSLTVTATGFSTYKQTGIELTVGNLATLDISLKVGATTETVEVSGAAPMVDVASSKVATNITDNVIENVPKGRSFQTLINFAPGARQEPLRGVAQGRVALEPVGILAGLGKLDGVVEVRGAGLLLAAELAAGIDAKDAAQRCLDAGLVVNAVTPTALRLEPSLLVSDSEIDEAVAIRLPMASSVWREMVAPIKPMLPSVCTPMRSGMKWTAPSLVGSPRTATVFSSSAFSRLRAPRSE